MVSVWFVYGWRIAGVCTLVERDELAGWRSRVQLVSTSEG